MSKVTRYRCNPETLSKVFGPDPTAGEDLLTALRRDFRIVFQEQTRDEIIFDMIGADPAIANAFRRVLLAEVPTVAIDRVYFYNNTSVVQDEVLAHRLGLVPLDVDPDAFEFMEEGQPATDMNTAVFRLTVKCEARTDRGKQKKKSKKHKGGDAGAAAAADGGEEGNAEDEYLAVYSGALEWEPQGGQAERFARAPIRPVHEDILLLKMKPGQEVDIEAHARKGVGKTHAKWSPVSTAYYRLHPEVELVEPVRGADADELARKCPMNVFDIEDLGGGGKRAVVARPRNCSMCRECIREPQWEQRVRLHRKRDHYIFHVESTGAVSARELVRRAARVLVEKCQRVLSALDTIEAGGSAAALGEGEDAAAAGVEGEGEGEGEERAQVGDDAPPVEDEREYVGGHGGDDSDRDNNDDDE